MSISNKGGALPRQARRKGPRSTRSLVLLVSASALQLLILTLSGPATGRADQPPSAPAQIQVTCGTRI
jgi:hypothetical protein